MPQVIVTTARRNVNTQELNEKVIQRVFGYVFARAEKIGDKQFPDRWIPPTKDDPVFGAYDQRSYGDIRYGTATFPCYCEDLIAAWMVIGKLAADGWLVQLINEAPDKWVVTFQRGAVVRRGEGVRVSLAVCLAALDEGS